MPRSIFSHYQFLDIINELKQYYYYYYHELEFKDFKEATETGLESLKNKINAIYVSSNPFVAFPSYCKTIM